MLEEYDEDYRDGMDNLCEMALSVCVKQVLAGKSLANRVFGREEENRIRETLEQGGARLLDEKIYPVLRKLVSKAGRDADALWFYLFPAIDSAFVRIQYTARHRGQEADDRVIEIELQREVTYETETTTAGLQRQSAETGTVEIVWIHIWEKVIKISLSSYWTGWGQKLWREVWRGMDSFSDAKKQTIIRYFHRLRLRPPHRSGVGFSRVSTVGLDGTATFRRSIRM